MAGSGVCKRNVKASLGSDFSDIGGQSGQSGQIHLGLRSIVAGSDSRS